MAKKPTFGLNHFLYTLTALVKILETIVGLAGYLLCLTSAKSELLEVRF
jgi:hypothetical protein